MGNLQSNIIELLYSITSYFETIRHWKNELNHNIVNVVNILTDNFVNLNKILDSMNPNNLLAEPTESLSNSLVAFIEAFNHNESELKKSAHAENLLQKYEVWGKALDSFLRTNGMNDYAMILLKRKYPPRTGLSNKVQIGEFTYGTPIINSWGENCSLKIGKFCSIAEQVTIFLGGNHNIKRVTTYPFNVFMLKHLHLEPGEGSKGDVIIGNDVWIGFGATIMSGVKIGDGSVIGARTVISRDVPPYAVVVGNPGKIVKYRFEDNTIERLLKVKWWNWSCIEIDRGAQYLLATDINDFLKYCSTKGYL